MLRTALYSRTSLTKAALVLVAFGTGALYGAPVLAQAVPPSAQPDRVIDQVIIPQSIPSHAANVNVPEIRIEGAPQGAENIKFRLNALTIDGVQAYSQADLSPIYEADLGQTITLTRLYEIAAQITRKYRADGYIISQVVVPEQKIDGGNARLLVVEGSLNGVNLEGDFNETDRQLVAQLSNKLTQSEPLNAADLERYLLLINDIPGLSARSIIGPSNVPGKADIRIITERDPFNFLLGADNYGSRYLGPAQLTAAAQFNNPLGLNDRLLAQFVTAPHKDKMYFSYLSYEAPITDEGTTLGIDASYSDTAPGYDLSIFKPKGHAGLLGMTVKHPLIRTRNENLNVFLRFDYLNAGTNNALEVKTKDDVRSIRIGGSYELLSNAFGTSVNTASVQISQGLNIFHASRKGDAGMSRPDGNPQYTKIEAEFARMQRIKAGLNALVAVKGQKSSSAVLSSEEFGLGGMASGYGRGYDPSEITGDSGFGAKAELQWNPSISAPMVENVQVYGFYDVGTVWDDDATTAKDRRKSLASTGFGARANVGPLQADATVAFPLTRKVATENNKDPRFFVSVTSRF